MKCLAFWSVTSKALLAKWSTDWKEASLSPERLLMLCRLSIEVLDTICDH